MTAFVSRSQRLGRLLPFLPAITALGFIGTLGCDGARDAERRTRFAVYGYIDATGRVILPGPYERATDFACGHALVQDGGTWWVLATSGEKTPVDLYNIERAHTFSEGVASIAVLAEDCTSEVYTVVGTDGKERMTKQLQSIASFSGGIALAEQASKWGAIGPDGRWVITNRYEAMSDFSHGKALAIVKREADGVTEREALLVDENGRESRIPGLCGLPERGYVTANTGGYRANSLYSLWTTSGELLFRAPAGRMMRRRPSEGLVFVTGGGDGKNGGFFDMRGREAFAMPADCDIAFEFSAGLAKACSTNGLWGFIDRKGRWAIAPRFQEVGSFHEGLAWVKIDGKVGYVDALGAMRIKAQYASGSDFHDGMARVEY